MPPLSHSRLLVRDVHAHHQQHRAEDEDHEGIAELPGMKLMFHISAMPPGMIASHGFRQRKIAHDEKYVPSQSSTSISMMNGSGSLLIPLLRHRRPPDVHPVEHVVRAHVHRPAGQDRQQLEETSVAPMSSATGCSSSACAAHARQQVSRDSAGEPHRV